MFCFTLKQEGRGDRMHLTVVSNLPAFSKSGSVGSGGWKWRRGDPV
jgi:hypothetical protein